MPRERSSADAAHVLRYPAPMPTEGELETRARARVGTWLRDKYRLEDLLGVGGMAAVYKATHRNHAEFAIKVLHPEWCADAEVLQRFHQEAASANRVKHPGVLRIIDTDTTEDGLAYLVMDLLEGAPLETIWARCGGRLPLPEVFNVAAQLLDVLASAHARGIVHRDIKPANLFIQRDGTLKVLDFGVARVRDAMNDMGSTALTSLTKTGVVLGTPAFMSPEQAGGETKRVDPRADLWAAGATLFTLISGRAVHGDAASDIELVVAAATKPAPSIASVEPGLAREAATLIDRALELDREKRWKSAEEMRAALDEASRAIFAKAPTDLPAPLPALDDIGLVSTERSGEHEAEKESDVPTLDEGGGSAHDGGTPQRHERREIEEASTELVDRQSVGLAAPTRVSAHVHTSTARMVPGTAAEKPPDAGDTRVLARPSVSSIIRSDPPPSPKEWADARASVMVATRKPKRTARADRPSIEEPPADTRAPTPARSSRFVTLLAIVGAGAFVALGLRALLSTESPASSSPPAEAVEAPDDAAARATVGADI